MTHGVTDSASTQQLGKAIRDNVGKDGIEGVAKNIVQTCLYEVNERMSGLNAVDNMTLMLVKINPS